MGDWDPFADPADAELELVEGARLHERDLSTEASQSRCLRVACLHGMASNAKIMRIQLARLAKKLQSTAELIYLDGRLPTEESNPALPDQKRLFPSSHSFLDWARCREDTPSSWRQYENLDEALDWLQSELARVAPLDGIIGFSQGANLASLLAAQSELGKGVGFHFVVHACAAGPGWTEQRPDLFQQTLRMPSLHISGAVDSMSTACSLAGLYYHPQILVHTDGHKIIPSSGGIEEADKVCAVISDFMHRATESLRQGQ